LRQVKAAHSQALAIDFIEGDERSSLGLQMFYWPFVAGLESDRRPVKCHSVAGTALI
jgi:hypothetical protein